MRRQLYLRVGYLGQRRWSMVGRGRCNQGAWLRQCFYGMSLGQLGGFGFRAGFRGYGLEKIGLVRLVNPNWLLYTVFLCSSACCEPVTDRQGSVIFNRTGMGFFLGYTQFRQQVDNRAGFDFQLPG